MGITLDTNFSTIKALNNSQRINSDIEKSIKRLSSGQKIQLAEDDASGMAIASSLLDQSAGLREAIKNANDGIGVMQIADSGLGQQVDLISSIRTKALSAANEGHSKTSILALQQEIRELIKEVDHVANTTTYNGLSILGGGFINKDFHTGTGSDSFVRFSIKRTTAANLGITRYETGVQITAASSVRLKFSQLDGKDWILDNTIISTSAGTGIGNVVDTINKNSDSLGIKARASVLSTSTDVVGRGVKNGQSVVKGLSINGISLGNIDLGQSADASEILVKTINSIEEQTGVRASLDIRGHLELQSLDNRGINIQAEKNGSLLHLSNIDTPGGHHNYGRLTLTQLHEPRDIVISGVNYTSIGFNGSVEAEDTINLSNLQKNFTVEQACAMGIYENLNVNHLIQDKGSGAIKPGVLTTKGAQAMIDSLDITLKNLETIRASIAATQNKLSSTVTNAISLSSNIRAAESQIRDTNYAEEASNLNTRKILLQANIFAITKSKAIRDLLLELLR